MSLMIMGGGHGFWLAVSGPHAEQYTFLKVRTACDSLRKSRVVFFNSCFDGFS